MAYEINQQYAKEIASENPPKGLKSVSKIAQGISESQYTQVIESRQKLTQAFIDQYLSSADLLILPCLGQSLPNWTEVEIGHPEFSRDAYLSLFQFMGFVNLLGLPSISFPIGDDARGRPVSIQAIARPLQEKTLLKFAQDMEQQLFDGYCYIDQIHQRRA
jgi:aspartyl-tRNA(Asn)/glutamyl-tRNA(Gln) amidotransferase subunit A